MTKLRIHYLQHVHFEDPGCIAQWTTDRGHELTATKLYLNENFPDIDAIDWLIILGGPMSANDGDEISWINPEKEFIKKAIDAGKIVIGICLGSQLIASALGGTVYANTHKEIGWFPIVPHSNHPNVLFYEEMEYSVFHWHGETFSLPDGARLLASSEACTNQAFSYGKNVIGLQFHFEATAEALQQMITFDNGDIDGSHYTQTAEYILSQPELITQNNSRMFRILDHFEQH